MSTDKDWPFRDPKNVAVYTVRAVWEKRKPILFVYHDEDDGAWQFHADQEQKESESSIVALSEIIKIDQSVKELADLPLGWTAWRKSFNDSWQRKKCKD